MRILALTSVMILTGLLSGPGVTAPEDSTKKPEQAPATVDTPSKTAEPGSDKSEGEPSSRSWAATQPDTEIKNRDARIPKTVPQE